MQSSCIYEVFCACDKKDHSRRLLNSKNNNLVHCKNTADKIKKVDWEKWSKENQNKSANEIFLVGKVLNLRQLY